MKVGILGSGSVGLELGMGFAKSGHTVMIGTRDPQKLRMWLQSAGPNAYAGSSAEAAAYGDVIMLATHWADDIAKKVIDAAGKENFKGKVVVDVTNPLKFEAEGKPPVPAISFPKSGGWQVQEWLPDAHVVKAFNIVTAAYMAHPRLEEGSLDLFICGNNAGAKKTVTEIAKMWGWVGVHDMGDIHQAWLIEALAFVWIQYGFLNKHWTHGFKLLKK